MTEGKIKGCKPSCGFVSHRYSHCVTTPISDIFFVRLRINRYSRTRGQSFLQETVRHFLRKNSLHYHVHVRTVPSICQRNLLLLLRPQSRSCRTTDRTD